MDRVRGSTVHQLLNPKGVSNPDRPSRSKGMGDTGRSLAATRHLGRAYHCRRQGSTTTDAWMAFWTVPRQTNHTNAIYGCLRTRWTANRGKEMSQNGGSTVAPWPAVADVLCYRVPGPYLMNIRHGEKEELTASREEVSAASGTVPRGRVIDGGGWREERRHGLGEIRRTVTKT